ncbi:hypothetical protein Tco_0748430 [Tanacetum coccineum]|uniref:Reverse transcriptase domain-containing protein n=1 Tax=Tanacetum coccineum TaxID=301880 RepID=A0ABQ4YVL8_9ASTR
MADTHTMSELLQAPTEGYRDAVVIPVILAKNFELKVGLLQLVTSSRAHRGPNNQGGNGYRPQGDSNYRASNQMGPPGFPPPNVQNNQNYNWYNQNQRRGQNFNQGNNNFQAPIYQAQVGPSNELTNYMNSNEATLRAMQTQMTNMKTELRNEFKSSLGTRTNKIENQNNQIMNMLTNLTMQKKNPSGSGSLPSNTIANPRGDVKAITTRSGVAYDGPTIPPTPSPLPKEVERETEATKGKVQTTRSESTTHVQPPVVQIPILEPDVAPKPNPKPSIYYPSRLNDQKLREKANNQILEFLQIFQRLHFDISFAGALLHMPKFASTFKSLLSNKEKLFELANTPLNENFSAVLLKQLPEKLGDPGKFLNKRVHFPKLDGALRPWTTFWHASINLMPLYVCGRDFRSRKLLPNSMKLELAGLIGVVIQKVFCRRCLCVKVEMVLFFVYDFVVVGLRMSITRVTLLLGEAFSEDGTSFIDVTWCMMAIFHDMIKETMEVFMDDFSVFGDSFYYCLSHLDKNVKTVQKTTNLVLQIGENNHFMVKEGIVLGHKISKSGIEVDKAKVDVIAKLPHPTSVKVNSMSLFVIKKEQRISEQDDILSRLENPHQGDLEKKEINETFPLETPGMISFHGNSSTPWFADIANYHVGDFVVKGMSSQ